MIATGSLGDFAIRHAKAVYFIVFALCLGGIFAALNTPSSVFPQTDFPRVVIMVDNGVMPADEMMATVTRPIEEAMKDIEGVVNIRSATGRGSAAVDVFFDWKVDMRRSELFVLGRLSQIRGLLPATATINASRLTFSAFMIIGISLTSQTRDITALWETARYEIKPRLLRIPGVARVDLVGGRTPEFHVIADPARLQAVHLGLTQVSEALTKTNLVAAAGLHEENHTLYLTLVDGRVHTPQDIENLAIATEEGRTVRVKDFARVERGPEPVFTIVTADGVNAVLLNIRSQPYGSTLGIADRLKEEMQTLKKQLPPDTKLAFFYDQSLLVRASVESVWEALFFGLFLSVVILYLFLKNWGSTLIATIVIPMAVLITLVAMKLADMTFNLMTLGGIAAAIGLIIDNAIVMVEAIYAKMVTGKSRLEAIREATGEIFPPLLGSTLTPVVVFIPLAFLDGVPGVFFRALAVTMVVSLLASLFLVVLLTPSLASLLVRIPAPEGGGVQPGEAEQGGLILRRVIRIYEFAVRGALRHTWIMAGLCGLVLLGAIFVYLRLPSDFLPEMDEGGFLIDYIGPPGTSLSETNRMLLEVEKILKTEVPEIESYSRRTGTAIGFFITEPDSGDFLVKLKPERQRQTKAVIADIRKKLLASQPSIQWEFPGIVGDLIGDLTVSPEPIEVKLYSTDLEYLKKKAPEIKDVIKEVKGVVDEKSGLVATGTGISFHVRSADAAHFGLTADDIAKALNTAMLGQEASSVLQGDRVITIRVKVDPAKIDKIATLGKLPLRTPNGSVVLLSQVADIEETAGELELHREDLRQNVSITARLEERDLGSAMNEIRAKLSEDKTLLPGMLAYGGLYEQQQESFRNLVVVLVMAVILVFVVLLLEFSSYLEPLSIVFGALLSLFGSIMALWVTGTSLNVISFLGGIIGVGIVAKNGILMLDFVDHLLAQGLTLEEALVRSGRRRLRPVLMTSMATALAMLPLAYGIGSGADMLKPLAIAVIGALCISVLLSLVATPAFYLLLRRLTDRLHRQEQRP